MSLPALRLNHLNLPARDPGALRAWYGKNLGFRAHGPFLWSGDSLLVFEEGRPIGSDSTHFGFRVESAAALKAWVEHLRSRGIAVGEIQESEAYSTVYIKDPEGNTFELFFEEPPRE